MLKKISSRKGFSTEWRFSMCSMYGMVDNLPDWNPINIHLCPIIISPGETFYVLNTIINTILYYFGKI